MSFTLVSASHMTQAGFKVLFAENLTIIKSPNSKIIGRIPKIRSLYRIRNPSPPSQSHMVCTAVMAISDVIELCPKKQFKKHATGKTIEPHIKQTLSLLNTIAKRNTPVRTGMQGITLISNVMQT